MCGDLCSPHFYCHHPGVKGKNNGRAARVNVGDATVDFIESGQLDAPICQTKKTSLHSDSLSVSSPLEDCLV
jgi:hypothetical protein